MAKVKLDIETDLTPVENAFTKGEEIIQESGVTIAKFGKDAKTAYMAAWQEANKYNKEVATATKQTENLGKESIKLGKTKSYVQQLKAEIKLYTSEAAKAGEGTKAFAENIAKAGKLKDELEDLNKAVQSLNGNIGENFARAAGNSISLVSRGYEGMIALQTLAGEKNEDFEKTIVKLQSLNAIANIAKEFGGIKDTLTEIKLGFAPILNLYTKGNEGIKNFFKKFKEGKEDVAENTSLFDKAKEGVTTFVKGGITGIKAFWATIVANPLGVILTLIGGLITAMVFLKDKVKPLAELFEFFGNIINAAIEPFKKLAEAMGLIADQSERKALSTIKNTEMELNAIKRFYDLQIKLAEANEKHTSNLESKKLTALQERVKSSIKSLELIKDTNGKLNEEQLKNYKEFTEQLEDIDNERGIQIAKRQQDIKRLFQDQQNAQRDAQIAGIKDDQTREEAALRAKFDDEKKAMIKQTEDAFGEILGSEMAEAVAEAKGVKIIEEQLQADLAAIRKKYAEKRKEENAKLLALEKDFQDAFLDVIKRVEANKTALLTGEARIEAETEVARKELDVLRKNLIAKGQAEEDFAAKIQHRKAENFKLTADQQEQFDILEAQLFDQQTQRLIAAEVERQNAIARSKAANAKQTEENLNTQENVDILTVEGTARPEGMKIGSRQELDFEEQKQIAILKIQKEYADKRLALKQLSLAAEREEIIKGYNGELQIIGEGEDAETQRKRVEVLKRVALTEEQFIQQQANAQAGYNAELAGIDNQLAKLNNKKPFDLAKLLGLTDTQLSDLQGAIQQLTGELQNLSNAYFDSKNAIVDEEIKKNQELVQERENNINKLESQLEKEKQLGEDGKANNFDRINQQIAFEEEKRQEGLANERKAKKEKAELAKQQLIIDTIVQASNLVVAATQIYATVAKDPYSTAIATATVVAMLAAFAIQKASAFQAVNKDINSNKFAGGVIDLKGPGTTTSDSIPAYLSRGESVMTANETADNLSLFKGIRYKNKALIQDGILDLLENTGVTLPKDLSKNLLNTKNAIKEGEIKIVLNNDYGELKQEQSATNKRLDELIAANKNITYKDQNGNLVQRTNTHTVITRKQ